ncbi:PH domain-containing protein [Acinetobacter sp. XS-4]|uniref:PH domain-containing protein n=1 Tax=Acinetobacter sp. XS-4 TaxID=2923375 RepID=UPI00208E2545|nr:PH domain-containing protein [Acinetobacter sp. XS-4]USP39512.1 PH domain-containing protein [Acinetobacter sp. XS-4]
MNKFKSKVDWWILVIFLGVTIYILNDILKLQSTHNIKNNFFDIIIYSILLWLIWTPIINTNYTIDKNYLIIKCTVLKWKIKIKSIQSVEKTYNPLSAPALSLDRLKIKYLDDTGYLKTIMISPKEKDEFIKTLNKENLK